jgi:hypothetical protein
MKKNHLLFFLLFTLQSTFALKFDPPTATIAYNQPIYCAMSPNAMPTISGTGNYMGGIFTASPVGIMVNPLTGVINFSESIAGTYEISYTVAPTNEDPSFTTTTTVTLMPAASTTLMNTLFSVCAGSDGEVLLTGTPNSTITLAIDNSNQVTVILSATGEAVLFLPTLTETTMVSLISATSGQLPWCELVLAGNIAFNVAPYPVVALDPAYTLNVDEENNVLTPVILDSQVTGNYTFQWYVDGILIPGAEESTYLVDTAIDTPEVFRTFSVVVTNNGNCSTTGITEVSQVMLSSEEFSMENFRLSPNPFSHFLNIKSVETIQQLAIFNVVGQLVYSQKGAATEMKLDLSSLPSGNYFAKINSEQQQQTFKLLKQ